METNENKKVKTGGFLSPSDLIAQETDNSDPKQHEQPAGTPDNGQKSTSAKFGKKILIAGIICAIVGLFVFLLTSGTSRDNTLGIVEKAYTDNSFSVNNFYVFLIDENFLSASSDREEAIRKICTTFSNQPTIDLPSVSIIENSEQISLESLKQKEMLIVFCYSQDASQDEVIELANRITKNGQVIAEHNWEGILYRAGGIIAFDVANVMESTDNFERGEYIFETLIGSCTLCKKVISFN